MIIHIKPLGKPWMPDRESRFSNRLKDGTSLPLGRNYRQQFLEQFG